MARVYLAPTIQALPLVYSVDSPVGPNCINKRDDVLLVQFFLKVISEHDRLYLPPGQSPMQIDGIQGPQTSAFIRQYQIENSRRNPGAEAGGGLKQDGVVHPVQAGSIIGSVGHTLLTIMAMNLSYKLARGLEMQRDITKDPLFPGALRPSLAVG